jgi:hypothetical protein
VLSIYLPPELVPILVLTTSPFFSCSGVTVVANVLSLWSAESAHPKKARRSVAFFAYLSKNLSKLGRGTKFVYDVVNLNDGNGYTKATGTFTAPSSGLYVFHVSTGVYRCD